MSFRGTNQPVFISSLLTCYHRLLGSRGKLSLMPSTFVIIGEKFFDLFKTKQAAANTGNIPGPQKLPIIGTSWIYMKYTLDPSKQPGKLTDYLQKQYGDIVAESLPGGVKIVHLFKADDFECVYRNDGQYPVRGIFPLVCRFNAKYNNNLHGLSTSEGKYWKHTRSAVQQKLFQRKYTEGWFSKHNEVTDELLELLEKKKNNDGIVCDMNTILERYTLEVITSACFKERLDANWTNLSENQIGTNYLSTLKLVNQLLIESLFSFPWYKFIDTPFFKHYSKINFQLDKYIITKMESEIADYSSKNNKALHLPENHNESLIFQLLEDNKLHKQEILTIVKDIISSSVFTLRSLLAFLLYALTQNTNIQNTIRKEIHDVLKKNNGQQLSPNTFDNMPYLKAFVKETLRCYPVTPGNVRQLDKDLHLKEYVLSKGTYVKMHHIYPAMSKDNFENPTEFCPERWLRTKNKMNSAHPFAVTQFGFGPRSCLGKRMALTEAYLFVMKILINYSIEYPDESFKIRSQLQYHPPNDLKFKFTKLPTSEFPQ